MEPPSHLTQVHFLPPSLLPSRLSICYLPPPPLFWKGDVRRSLKDKRGGFGLVSIWPKMTGLLLLAPATGLYVSARCNHTK